MAHSEVKEEMKVGGGKIFARGEGSVHREYVGVCQAGRQCHQTLTNTTISASNTNEESQHGH